MLTFIMPVSFHPRTTCLCGKGVFGHILEESPPRAFCVFEACRVEWPGPSSLRPGYTAVDWVWADGTQGPRNFGVRQTILEPTDVFTDDEIVDALGAVARFVV